MTDCCGTNALMVQRRPSMSLIEDLSAGLAIGKGKAVLTYESFNIFTQDKRFRWNHYSEKHSMPPHRLSSCSSFLSYNAKANIGTWQIFWAIFRTPDTDSFHISLGVFGFSI
jgi:hypothetical protein